MIVWNGGTLASLADGCSKNMLHVQPAIQTIIKRV